MSDDLDALFGTSEDFVNNLVSEAKTENLLLSVIKEPETELEIDNLLSHILKKADNMLNKACEAMEEVFMCVLAEPTNPDTVNAASGMLRSYTSLLGELSKLNTLNEKYKQQKELMKMKIESEQSMNQNDNETALLMKREELMAIIMKQRDLNKVIDTN